MTVWLYTKLVCQTCSKVLCSRRRRLCCGLVCNIPYTLYFEHQFCSTTWSEPLGEPPGEVSDISNLVRCMSSCWVLHLYRAVNFLMRVMNDSYRYIYPSKAWKYCISFVLFSCTSSFKILSLTTPFVTKKWLEKKNHWLAKTHR